MTGRVEAGRGRCGAAAGAVAPEGAGASTSGASVARALSAAMLLAAGGCVDSTGPRWVDVLRADPDSAHLLPGGTAAFDVRAFDQLGDEMAAEWVPRVHWRVGFNTADAVIATLGSGVSVTVGSPGTAIVQGELGRGRVQVPVYVRPPELDHVEIRPNPRRLSTAEGFSHRDVFVYLYDVSGEELPADGYRISWTTTDTMVARVSAGARSPRHKGVRGLRRGSTRLKVIVNDVVGFGDVVVVDVPLGVSAPRVAALSPSSLRVTWNVDFGMDEGYRLYRSLSQSSGYAHIATQGVGGMLGLFDTTYVDSGLEPATAYFYVVESCNDFGCSERSPPGTGTTPPG